MRVSPFFLSAAALASIALAAPVALIPSFKNAMAGRILPLCSAVPWPNAYSGNDKLPTRLPAADGIFARSPFANFFGGLVPPAGPPANSVSASKATGKKIKKVKTKVNKAPPELPHM
ncbi:hypothetical protein FA95DRAFT_1606907 [Auriscalpium vulgare]|uniref:Uncharacterized protein n=1 Tax=Auriscalpium vulgare TaxID=40419 RepID=A0ACB8RR82_9AGAM|nr:hypothetical protein FA95DRAFT_1606907 [Auriscalpium vulgare]